MKEMLITMMDRMCQIPRFANAWKIYIGERNTGHVSGIHGAEVMGDPRYGTKTYSLREKKDRNVGIWTSHDRKIYAAEHFREAMRRRRIIIYEKFIVYNKDNEPVDEYRTKVIRSICSQFRNFLRDPSGKLSGKTDIYGKKIADQVDDLAFAAINGVYHAKYFLAKYLNYVDYTVFSDTTLAAGPDMSTWR